MEPIAVCRITVDKRLFSEACAAVFSKKRQKMLLWCGIAFAFFGALFLVLREKLPMLVAAGLLSFVMGIYTVFWALTLERSNLKKKYKRFVRRYGETSERTVRCYDRYLEIDNGFGEPRRIEYTDVRERRETDHMVLLLCLDRTGVQLAKDGWASGSAEVLWTAIEQAKEVATLELL